MRRITEARFKRCAFQANGPSIGIRKAFDPRILLTETNTPGKQYQGCAEFHAAKIDSKSRIGCHLISLVARRLKAFVIVFDVVLWEPEIPPNTGNIIRLCANTGCTLHLLEPLGFDLDDRALRRAGLDYREYATVEVHSSFESYLGATGPNTVYAFSTRGQVDLQYLDAKPGDSLLFGPETRGLPTSVLDSLPDEQLIRLPMVATSRSLNLSNAVAIAVYEAWRRHGYAGSTPPTSG